MFSLTFFILLSIVVNTNAVFEKIEQNLATYEAQYFKNLMKHYASFRKIIHFDEVTKDRIRDVSKLFTYIQHVIIYNYDHSYQNMIRPLGDKILNIVILPNLTYFERFSGNISNICGKDVILVISENRTYGQKLPLSMKTKNIRSSGRLLLFNFKKSSIEMFYVCQYCGIYSDRVILLQRTEGIEVNIPSKFLQPNDFNDFYGHNFSILFNQYFPYMQCLVYIPTKHNNESFNKCLRWVGSEGALVQALANKMNFTYNFIALTEYITVPKMLPHLEQNENVNFAIGGIAILYEDTKKLSFSRQIEVEKVVLMYKKHVGWKDRFFAFMNAFDMKLWILLDATVLLYATTFFVFGWILYGVKSISIFWSITRMLLRVMIEQPIVNKCLIKKMRLPVLILMLLWTFGCVDFSVLYKSSLSSQIIHPPTETYSDIFELLSEGYKIGMEDSHFYNLNISFKLSEAHVEQFKRNIFRMDALCKGVEMALESKVAVAGEFSFLYHHCQQHSLVNYNYAHEVSFAQKSMSTVLHGWIFRKGAPYIDAFNRILLRLQTSGLMSKWSKDTLRKKKQFFYSRDASLRRGRLGDFVSHFTLYGIGMGLSLCVFIAEHIYHRISVNYFTKK